MSQVKLSCRWSVADILLAHRFLVGYVYGRTHSQTGGLLQIWLLRRFGTVVAFQPILLGLIYLSRELWIEGGILCGVGGVVMLFMESYATWKTRLPGRKSLSHVTQDSLDRFVEIARPKGRRNVDEESTRMREEDSDMVSVMNKVVSDVSARCRSQDALGRHSQIIR